MSYQNILDYVCDYCSRTFTRKYNLQTHIENCHTNPSSHCNICGQSCGSMSGLQLHLSRGHNSLGQPFPECDVCGRVFTRKQNILSHMITVHLQGLGDDIRCLLCDKTFTTERNLKRHTNQQHNPNVEYPICHHCDRVFKSKPSLITHIQTLHSTGERDSIKCTLCDKVYTNIRNMKRHIEVFHEKKGVFRCDMCPKVYTSNQSLRRHSRYTHTTENIEQYSCNFCGKVITGRENFDNHLQFNHQSTEEIKNDKEIVCEICHQVYEEEPVLRQHIKNEHSFEEFYKYCKNALIKHYGTEFMNNLYKCEYCQHSFSSVYELKDHMRVSHDTEYSLSTCNVCFNKFYSKETMATHKKFCVPPPNVKSCMHCDKLFTDISSLEFHNRIFHPQAQIADLNITATNLDEDTTSFKCENCDRIYYSERSLKHHVKLKHTTDEQVECVYCNKICNNKYYLASHIKIVHNNDSWSHCEYCNKQFKSKRNIRRHIEYTHLGMQRYKCIECETLFKEKRSLRKHVRTKHPNSALFPQCHICHKRFESAKSCKIHLKLLHSFNMNTYPCHLCSVSFSSNEALKIHLNTKHLAEDQIYKCEECNLVFKGQEKFDRHNGVHHVNLISHVKQKVLPRCILCTKDFSTRKTLKRHIKKFHTEFEVQELANFGSRRRHFNVDCEECLKKFNNELHRRTYQKLKHIKNSIIFKCDTCGCSYNCLEYAIQQYKLRNTNVNKTKTILSELCTTEMSEDENFSARTHQELPKITSERNIKIEPNIKSEPNELEYNDNIKIEPMSP